MLQLPTIHILSITSIIPTSLTYYLDLSQKYGVFIVVAGERGQFDLVIPLWSMSSVRMGIFSARLFDPGNVAEVLVVLLHLVAVLALWVNLHRSCGRTIAG